MLVYYGLNIKNVVINEFNASHSPYLFCAIYQNISKILLSPSIYVMIMHLRSFENVYCNNIFKKNEPPHGKTNNLHRPKQRRRSSFAVTAKLISAFVFATRIVQFLFYLNPKFQASCYFLCLYSLVCVEPVRKPHCWFSHVMAQILMEEEMYCPFYNSLHLPLNLFSLFVRKNV